MASTGKVASQDRAANPAPTSAARTKQTVVVVRDADPQNVAVIGKYRRLPRKCDRRIAAVGEHIHKRHASTYSGSHRAKIEVHRPVGKGADGDAPCVQAGHSNGEIAFERLVEKRAPIVDRGVVTHQKAAGGRLHSQGLRKHIERTTAS